MNTIAESQYVKILRLSKGERRTIRETGVAMIETYEL